MRLTIKRWRHRVLHLWEIKRPGWTSQSSFIFCQNDSSSCSSTTVLTLLFVPQFRSPGSRFCSSFWTLGWGEPAVPAVPGLRDLGPPHLGAGQVDPGLTGAALDHRPAAVGLPTVASDLRLLLLEVIWDKSWGESQSLDVLCWAYLSSCHHQRCPGWRGDGGGEGWCRGRSRRGRRRDCCRPYCRGESWCASVWPALRRSSHSQGSACRTRGNLQRTGRA